MGYLPIFIDLSERPCVVIGGGEIAERKTRSLIEAGASVVIISPAITAGLAAMSRAGTIRHLARRYRHGDLADAFLAFDATGDGATARAAAAEARVRGVSINVADVPELCTFISPAVVQRGGLQIAISTGGASPALARKIREDLEGLFGPEYEFTISLLERARRWLRLQESDAGTRARLLNQVGAFGIARMPQARRLRGSRFDRTTSAGGEPGRHRIRTDARGWYRRSTRGTDDRISLRTR